MGTIKYRVLFITPFHPSLEIIFTQIRLKPGHVYEVPPG